MTTQTEIAANNHRRAVRFFWGLLIGATTVSLIGHIAHAVLPYLPRVVIQIGTAAVPPIALGDPASTRNDRGRGEGQTPSTAIRCLANSADWRSEGSLDLAVLCSECSAAARP